MGHFANDRAGPNEGNRHDEVVKPCWKVSWQRGHLRAALHLEHPDGVSSLQGPVYLVIFGQLRKIYPVAVVLWYQIQTVLNDRHHAEAQQIDLDDAEIRAVFFVPL